MHRSVIYMGVEKEQAFFLSMKRTFLYIHVHFHLLTFGTNVPSVGLIDNDNF